MTNRLTAGHPAASIRLAVCLGLATATLIGTLAGPAYADNDHDNWNGNGNRHWHQPRPAPQRYYYRQPDVYYSAPPVVYQPYYQPYYQPPGALLNFNFR
jgi:hypothetical protein